MAQYPQKLSDKKFQNYIKEDIALLIAKEGLEDFVLDVMTRQQNDILQYIYINNGVTRGDICTSCTTGTVIPCPTPGICKIIYRQGCKFHGQKVPTTCPKNICSSFRNLIHRDHEYKGPSFKGPSWKNTDASQWCVDPYSIAKCYMPPDGYLLVNTLQKTDFNGIIAVIINNTCFDINKISSQAKSNLQQVRDIGKFHRHSSDLSIQDSDLTANIDTLIDLLNDPVCLKSDTKAKGAVQNLQKIKSDSFTILPHDITRVLDEVIERKIKGGIEGISGHARNKTNEMDEQAEIRSKSFMEETDSKRKEVKEDLDKHAKSKIYEADLEMGRNAERKMKDVKKEIDQAKKETREAIDKIREHTQNAKKEIDQEKQSAIRELQSMKKVISEMNTHDISKIFHHRTEDSELLSDLVMSRIAAKLGFEWNMVALELRLTQANIEQIQMSHEHEGAHKMILSVLLKWRDSSTGTDEEKFKNLIKALQDCNRNDLADELMAQHEGP